MQGARRGAHSHSSRSRSVMQRINEDSRFDAAAPPSTAPSPHEVAAGCVLGSLLRIEPPYKDNGGSCVVKMMSGTQPGAIAAMHASSASPELSVSRPVSACRSLAAPSTRLSP